MTSTHVKSANNRVTRLANVKPYLKINLVLVVVFMLSACSVEEQLPIGASLSIEPSDRTLTVGDRTDVNGNCLIDPEDYIDWPILLALTDGSGTPVGNQDVRVYLDFAANTYAGYPVMELYDDVRGNANGVVDDYELVSDDDDDIAVVKTDLYGGDRSLLLRINISCPFRGEVFAFVEGVSARATIEINVGTEQVLDVVANGSIW